MGEKEVLLPIQVSGIRHCAGILQYLRGSSETTGAIVTWSAGKESLPNQASSDVTIPSSTPGDHLGFIMLVGYKAIRKLVVMSVHSVQRSLRIIRYSFTPPSFFRIRSLVSRYFKVPPQDGQTGVSSLLITKNTGVRLVGQCVF